MWPLLVVVLNELLEDVFQVPLTEDEQVVEHLAACCPHPALRICVRPRGPVGQLDHLHALASEDVIEGSAELGVAIAKQKADLLAGVLKPPGQVASLLGHPFPAGVGGNPGQMDPAAADLDENNT
jgi:hypothetical protein